MYKLFKITKRVSIAFNTFNKQAKDLSKEISKAYSNGYFKSTDEINSFDTHFFILGTFRIMVYIEHKRKCGHCCN
jgi:hypothetical protein